MMKIEPYKQLDIEISGSFAYKFKVLAKEFLNNEINKYSIKELKDYYQKFDDLHKMISALNTTYYNDYSQSNKERKDDYLQKSEKYINNIESRYLNRIIYRLNEIQTRKNIRSARFSIILGFISVIFGIASILIGIITICDSEKNNKNYLLLKQQEVHYKECVSDFNIIKSENQQQLKTDSILNEKIDSFKTKMDSIDKRMNSKNKNLK